MGSPTGRENLPELPEGNSYLVKQKGTPNWRELMLGTLTWRELPPDGNFYLKGTPTWRELLPEGNSYLKGTPTWRGTPIWRELQPEQLEGTPIWRGLLPKAKGNLPEGNSCLKGVLTWREHLPDGNSSLMGTPAGMEKSTWTTGRDSYLKGSLTKKQKGTPTWRKFCWELLPEVNSYLKGNLTWRELLPEGTLPWWELLLEGNSCLKWISWSQFHLSVHVRWLAY